MVFQISREFTVVFFDFLELPSRHDQESFPKFMKLLNCSYRCNGRIENALGVFPHSELLDKYRPWSVYGQSIQI